MKIIKGYKVKLDLNNCQWTACAKHAGTARYAYNWGLARKIESYQKTGKSPNAIALHRELNQLKKTELSWMYEVSKCAPQEALRDLDVAFKNFFRRVKQGEKPGFPKFKSKKCGLGSVRLTGTIKVFEAHIQLPRLGLVRLTEKGYIPTSGIKILSATVSEKAGQWFVSVQAEQEVADPEPVTEAMIGIDLGIKTMATCSNGQTFKNPKALAAKTEQLKRWQKRLSRRKKGSRNREKARRKVAKLHAQIANIRRDALHKATSAIIAQKPRVVVIEDLNVSGMMANHKLARAISDVGMHEFKRQISYKAGWVGVEVIVADRFYPSSKTCSCCGSIKTNLSLSERVFHCEFCGFSLDRDLNAAINLSKLSTASSVGSNACGDGRLQSLGAVPVFETGIKPQMSPFV